MTNNALYFPYINVPNDPWLYQMLIYWDKLGSIVPSEYVFAPEMLDPFMRDLVFAELIEQIIPLKFIHAIPNFEEAFIQHVRKSVRKHHSYKNYRSHGYSEIHIEKLGGIADELVDLELARPADYPWYGVIDWVAKDFMAYLATSLGKLEEIDAAPVTNEFNQLRKNQLNQAANSPRVEIRSKFLKGLFPTPSDPLDIDKLLLFKNDHGHLLKKLRNHMEMKYIEISNIQDKESREELIDRTIQDIETRTDEIEDAMRTSWKHITFGAIVPILGVGMEAFSGHLTDPFMLLTFSLSVIGAVYKAYEGVSNYKKIRNEPFAYITLARRSFPTD